MLNQEHGTTDEGCSEHSALSLGRVGGFSVLGGWGQEVDERGRGFCFTIYCSSNRDPDTK